MNNATTDDLDNLRHMLGVGNHIPKRDWGYRNYFAAGSGNDQAEMERLVSAGLATRGRSDGDLTFYHATESGMDAIGMTAAAKRRAMEP